MYVLYTGKSCLPFGATLPGCREAGENQVAQCYYMVPIYLDADKLERIRQLIVANQGTLPVPGCREARKDQVASCCSVSAILAQFRREAGESR
jgi:hypothetical protein